MKIIVLEVSERMLHASDVYVIIEIPYFMKGFEKTYKRDGESGKLLSKANSIRDEMINSFNDKQKKQLENYDDLNNQALAHLEFEAFLSGFRLATKLMCEAIVGTDLE